QDTPLEQLAHHPKRELDLKLRSARTQNLLPKFRRASARRLDERRLAKTDAALDQEDFARSLEQCLNCGQFTVPLEQLHSPSLLEDPHLAKTPGRSRFTFVVNALFGSTSSLRMARDPSRSSTPSSNQRSADGMMIELITIFVRI